MLPFYAYLFGTLLVGIVIGGLATWMTQARWRRTARRRAAEAQRWQAEADRLSRERQAQLASTGRQLAPVQPLGPQERAAMRFFDGAAVDRALAYPALVDVLEAAFRKGAIAPLRHHHAIALDGRPEATLLLMPAWEASAPGAAIAGRYLGVKSVTVFPDNASARQAGRVRHLPAVLGRDRRDAGGDGRHPAHGLAHGRGLGARQPLPLPAGSRRGC